MKERHTAYLLIGDDDFAATSRAQEIVAGILPPDQQVFGLETIDAAAETVEGMVQAMDQCVQAFGTVSFIEDGGKVVWLRDARFLALNPDAQNRDVRSRVDLLARGLQSGALKNHTLIVTAPEIHDKSPLLKVGREKGRVEEFQAPRKSSEVKAQTRDRVARELSARDLRAEAGAVEEILNRVDGDGWQIESEVEKLALYMGGAGSVTSRDVRAVVSSSREAPVWELTGAAGQRKLADALIALGQLLEQKMTGVGIAMSLASCFRELLVYRVALDKGWLKASDRFGSWGSLPPEIESLFVESFDRDPRKVPPYRVAMLAGQARLFTHRELIRCLDLIQAAHERLVTGGTPDRLVIEMLLVRMLR